MIKNTILAVLLICLSNVHAFIPPIGSLPFPLSPKEVPESSSSNGYINGVPAMGFQYDSGAAWAALCKNTAHGTVPGKRDDGGGVYYAWGGKEHGCTNYDLIHGDLIHHSMALPSGCEPKGLQSNDNNKYYNAVVDGVHGMVPGKAKADLTMAWYSWGGKEYYVRSKFYVIC